MNLNFRILNSLFQREDVYEALVTNGKWLYCHRIILGESLQKNFDNILS